MAQNTHKYTLEGLSCSNCAMKIEKTLKSRDFTDVRLNFATQTLSFSCSNSKCSHTEEVNTIISQIEPGIQVKSLKDFLTTPKSIKDHAPLFQVPISVSLLVIGLVMTYPTMSSSINLVGYVILFLAYISAGWKVLWRAVLQLKKFDITNEHFLMSVATIGAILIQEVPEAVAVMIFYTVGELLQNRAINHSRRSISSLLDIRPDRAHLIEDDSITTVPVADVNPGDTILVKPGERVPLDGIIVQGQTLLDMSILTGESRPINAEMGMEVFSGSISNRSIHIRVTSPCQESTVSRILNAVENAATKKSSNELFITRFSRIYTPMVLIIALLLAIVPPLIFSDRFDLWFYRALVVLVISCPCALVVSIPLVYFSGIGKSSREGILLKGANVIDSLNKISTVYWDKTGTLTVGKFHVVTIVPDKNVDPETVLSYAALAEAHSNHPIAVSIRETYGKPLDLTQIKEYEEFPALGIKMRTVANDTIVVGNDKLVHEIHCAHAECVLDETAVYVVKNGKYLGHIIIDDQIRENSRSAITKLKALSISNIGLLTGDTKNIAERVGAKVGISNDEIYASLMPLNKLEILEQEIQDKANEGSVIFVGDGINDAPVIARADVGVAMGGIGSDATIEAADLVIMDDNPLKLGEAIEIARHTDRIAKQNILFAIGLKAVFIFLGVIGLANMWVAVFGDMGVALLTILNSLRLLR